MARSAATTRCSRALAHPLNHQLGEFCGGPGDVGAFFSVPIRRCVAHAENCECREPGIEIGSEFPFGDALLDDILEDALESARPPADPTAAFPGKVLALIEKDANEVGPVDQGREMGSNQQSQAFGGTFRPRRNGFCSVEKPLDALHADEFKRGLLGRKVIVEARLLDTEDVGDVLRGRAVKPSLGKNACRGLNDLGGSPSEWAEAQISAGQQTGALSCAMPAI